MLIICLTVYSFIVELQCKVYIDIHYLFYYTFLSYLHNVSGVITVILFSNADIDTYDFEKPQISALLRECFFYCLRMVKNASCNGE